MTASLPQLLATEPAETILAALGSALERSGESPLWAEKLPPLARAQLSVLIPLRDRGLLFDPEGVPQERLTPELWLRWCDLMSLRHLAFTLARSNRSGRLEGTRHTQQEAARYLPLGLDPLESYLAYYRVDLRNEYADFPVVHYNFHTGLNGVLKGLLA